MDVVYPLKEGGPYEEFRYSLRSLGNLPHDNVWVIGARPEWARSVLHVPTKQDRPTKYENLCVNITAACENPEISDPFVIFNDDFFIMEPIDEVPVHWRETIPQASARYVRRGMTDWLRHLRRVHRNTGAVRSYELHIPMVVQKAEMLEAIERGTPGPLWRTAYGAVAGLEGTRLPDVKVMRVDRDSPGGPFASSSDRTFIEGLVGRRIVKTFPDPSEYE